MQVNGFLTLHFFPIQINCLAIKIDISSFKIDKIKNGHWEQCIKWYTPQVLFAQWSAHEIDFWILIVLKTVLYVQVAIKSG